MFYTRLQVTCDPLFSEIIMAEIGGAGFDTFMETDNGFEAYVENENFDVAQLDFILEKYAHVKPLEFLTDRIDKKNWNEEWEKNLETIVVDDTCLIRAGFHVVDKKYPYEIIITPKMSFGTGHHQTTYLMISNQMKIDHRNKRIMDAGCGTAILSIMASKRGAKIVEAFDIDEWSVINGNENAENNRCDNVNIRRGNILDMSFSGVFDIILANINKNVLLQDMESYAKFLAPGGLLLISGFYSNDADDLVKKAQKSGLTKETTSDRETWAAILLRKA